VAPFMWVPDYSTTKRAPTNAGGCEITGRAVAVTRMAAPVIGWSGNPLVAVAEDKVEEFTGASVAHIAIFAR
jgi:hypothetical protein